MAPVDPWKRASPKAKMPPSDATNQYPLPDGVSTLPTIGWLRRTPPSEPKKPAVPKVNTAPSDVAIRYPAGAGGDGVGPGGGGVGGIGGAVGVTGADAADGGP